MLEEQGIGRLGRERFVSVLGLLLLGVTLLFRLIFGSSRAAGVSSAFGLVLLALHASLTRRGRVLPRMAVTLALVGGLVAGVVRMVPLLLGDGFLSGGWTVSLVLAICGAVLVHAFLGQETTLSKDSLESEERVTRRVLLIVSTAAPAILLALAQQNLSLAVRASREVRATLVLSPSLLFATVSVCLGPALVSLFLRERSPHLWWRNVRRGVMSGAGLLAALALLSPWCAWFCALGVAVALGTLTLECRSADSPEDAELMLAMVLLELGLVQSSDQVLVLPVEEGEPLSSLMVTICVLSLASACALARGRGAASPVTESPLSGLSVREREVAEGVLAGKSVRGIADELGISRGSVGTYCARLYKKMKVASREEFVAALAPASDEKLRGHDHRPTLDDKAVLALMASALVLLMVLVLPWTGFSSLPRGAGHAIEAEGAFAEIGALIALAWLILFECGTSRGLAAAACVGALASTLMLIPALGALIPLSLRWLAQLLVGGAVTLALAYAVEAASNERIFLWAPVIALVALRLAPASWEGVLMTALLASGLMGACGHVCQDKDLPNEQLDMGYVPALPDALFLICGGMGLGAFSRAVASMRVDWPYIPGIGGGTGDLTRWLVMGAIVAVLVTASAVCGDGKRPASVDRAAPLGAFIFMMALLFATRREGPPAWGQSFMALAGLPQLAFITLLVLQTRLLGEVGASRYRVLASLAVPVLVGSMLVRASGFMRTDLAPAAALCVALGAAGTLRAAATLRRRALSASLGAEELAREMLCERGLTETETRVALLLARGLGTPAIAERLVVSRATVATHRRSIYHKLEVHSQGELVRLVGKQLAELSR